MFFLFIFTILGIVSTEGRVRFKGVRADSSEFLPMVDKLWRDTFIGVAFRGVFYVSINKCIR